MLRVVKNNIVLFFSLGIAKFAKALAKKNKYGIIMYSRKGG